MRRSTVLRTTGVILLTLGAVAAVGAVVVRDQLDRHQRDLFSAHPLKRFAALGYIAGLAASVEMIRLLRDFIAWEPRTVLRRRARHILDRMERQLLEHGPIALPHPGIAG
jgi:hypothetical protein